LGIGEKYRKKKRIKKIGEGTVTLPYPFAYGLA